MGTKDKMAICNKSEAILLTSVGTTWEVIPEIFCALMAPQSFYKKHKELRRFKKLEQKDSPIREIWAIGTEVSIEKTEKSLITWLREINKTTNGNKSREPVKIRFFVLNIKDPVTEEDNRELREALFRIFLYLWKIKKKNNQEGNDLKVFVSLAGGIKTMSTYTQEWANLFQVDGIYHVLFSTIQSTPERKETVKTKLKICGCELIDGNVNKIYPIQLPLSRKQEDFIEIFNFCLEEKLFSDKEERISKMVTYFHDLPEDELFFNLFGNERKYKGDNFEIIDMTLKWTKNGQDFLTDMVDHLLRHYTRYSIKAKHFLIREEKLENFSNLFHLPFGLFRIIYNKKLDKIELHSLNNEKISDRLSEKLWNVLKKMPKIDLHCHMGGAAYPSDLIKIAEANLIEWGLLTNPSQRNPTIYGFFSHVNNNLKELYERFKERLDSYDNRDNSRYESDFKKLDPYLQQIVAPIKHIWFLFSKLNNTKQSEQPILPADIPASLLKEEILEELFSEKSKSEILDFKEKLEGEISTIIQEKLHPPYKDKDEENKAIRKIHDAILLSLFLYAFDDEEKRKKHKEEHLIRFLDGLIYQYYLYRESKENNIASIENNKKKTYSLDRPFISWGIKLEPYMKWGDWGGSSILQTERGLRKAVDLIYHHAFEQNEIYLEIRFSPNNYCLFLNNPKQVVKIVQDELKKARLRLLEQNLPNFYDIKNKDLQEKWIFFLSDSKEGRGRYKPVPFVTLILIGTKNKELDEIKKNINLAIELMEESVEKNKDSQQRMNQDNIFSDPFLYTPQTKFGEIRGFDLAGQEAGIDHKKFSEILEDLHKYFFNITIHAGEEGDVQNVIESIYKLNADRIGHGLSAKDEMGLIEKMKNHNITVELCPTSNSQIIGFGSPFSEKEYPYLKFKENGIRCTINTDDPGISRTTLLKEYLMLVELTNERVSLWDFFQVVKNAIDSSFLKEEDKVRFRNVIGQRLVELITEELSEYT